MWKNGWTRKNAREQQNVTTETRSHGEDNSETLFAADYRWLRGYIDL